MTDRFGDQPPLDWRDVARGEPDELRRRIHDMPEEAWSRDPAALLCLAAAYRIIGGTNPYAAEPYLDIADEVLRREGSDPALRVLAPVVRAVTLRELGRLAESRRLLTMAAKALSTAPVPFATRVELHALILLNDGISSMLGGTLDEARCILLRALHVAESHTPATVRAEASGCLAFIELRTGSLRGADTHLAAARAASVEVGSTRRLDAAPVRLAEIAVAIEGGRVDGLDEELAELLADTAGSDYEPLVLAESAAVHGPADDSVPDVLQELQLVIREWEFPNLPRMMHDDSRIALLVRRHEVVAARAQIARIVPDDAHSQCPGTWLGRLALDAGEPADAIELTTPCVAMGDAHSPRTAVLAMLVNASAHAMLGDLSTADALFAHALVLAAPTRAVRPFGILPGRQLTVLLGRVDGAAQSPAVRSVLEGISLRFSADDDTPDALSVRERVVLARLVAGDTQQRISFQLSVSPNTVKTQVRSIYRKLGVTTRDGAVQRARRLGIIS